MPTRITLYGIAATLLPLTVPASAEEWSYGGAHGPQNWGEASPVCAEGKMQSPIDLDQANVAAEVSVSVDYSATDVSVENLGSTVQANFPGGSYLVSSGKVFELKQVHFHTPSEHTIAGESFPLVAHFVHASGAGELAVLGVLFEEGDENSALEAIVDAAPDDMNAQARTAALDVRGLLPGELEVFRYMGSLTTPPCSEGVHWHVAEETLEASEEQIARLNALMGDNARPVLPLNNRLLIAPD